MTDVLFPPLLGPGDPVRIIAPAGPVPKEGFDEGEALLSRWFTVQKAPAVFARKGYLAGDDAVRLADFQKALSDGAKAVIAARGGFGSSRILDRIDWASLAQRPRWIVGCSDLTAVLVHLFGAFRLATIHGPMVARMGAAAADAERLQDLLQTGCGSDVCPLTPLVPGSAEGPLVGGNLTVMAHLCGTIAPDFAKGCILFIEDVNEAPYRIDRCLVQLARAGVLRHVAGVVFGEFTDCPPGLDSVAVDEVLADHFTDAPFPVASGYPAAHGLRNRPFIHGGMARLQVDSNAAALDDRR